MTSPLDSVRADDIARFLAERNSRVYPLQDVADMTGFAFRSLQRKCRAGELEHVHEGHFRGMTLRQIDLLVATRTRGVTGTPAPTDLDEVQDAIARSRRSAQRAPRRAAA